MNRLESSIRANSHIGSKSASGVIERAARRMVMRRLGGIAFGGLTITDKLEFRYFGVRKTDTSISASIEVHDHRFYSYLALGGAVGAAEAYIQGFWSVDDLTTLIRVFARNRDVLEQVDSVANKIAGPVLRVLHSLNKNTRKGSHRNIAAHYDLGNDFFGLWLDSSMMYSCAIFENPNVNLDEASEAKLDRICQKLELNADDHVLEIGTGWGGFAVFAARKYGCRVTSTTISKEQYEFAVARVSEAGLDDRVTLLLEDYRDLHGQFDKLVSIEMIEAVGHEYIDTYFQQCNDLLKPDGMMLLQAITIADQRYDRALRSVDFIQRYIFPGGFLPSVTAMMQSITASTNMRLHHMEAIGDHYAETLRVWRDRFSAQINQVRSMGYPAEFLRMWEYYYCYCEGAFIERAIDCAQLLLVKPDCRRQALIPSLCD